MNLLKIVGFISLVFSFLHATEYKCTVKCGGTMGVIRAQLHYTVNSSKNSMAVENALMHDEEVKQACDKYPFYSNSTGGAVVDTVKCSLYFYPKF